MDDAITQEEVAGWAQRQGGGAPDEAPAEGAAAAEGSETTDAAETLRAHADGLSALADQIETDLGTNLHDEPGARLTDLLASLRASVDEMKEIADEEEGADAEDDDEEEAEPEVEETEIETAEPAAPPFGG